MTTDDMKQPIKIGSHSIGTGNPCFIIAEVGSNHNGSLACAKEMIDAAAEARVDAVKFQSIKFEELYIPELETSERRDFIRSIELPEEWYAELAAWAKKRGICFFSAPTYTKAIGLLEAVDVPAYKVASPQAAANGDLVRQVLRLKKPTIISTGYATYEGISRTMKMAKEEENHQVILLHCVSEYPTDPSRVNLRAIHTLQSMFRVPVGFSDHTLGSHLTTVAVALGATVIEKHFTLDRKQKGPDHFFAIEPKELQKMVKEIRDVEQSLGDGTRTQISNREEQQLAAVRTCLIAKVAIPVGTALKEDLLLYRRAPYGMSLDELPYVMQAVASQNIPAMTPITRDQLKFLK